jgi:hypothetical protein
MRWFLSAALGLFLLWAGYVASPYLALWTLATAIERGDIGAVTSRLNVHALRLSLARQLAEEEIKASRQPISATDRQLIANAMAIAADPLLQQIFTPDAMARLIQGPLTGADEGGAPSRKAKFSADDVTQLVGASRWRGFRNVYFRIPPDRATDQSVRLQFRLSRLAWRLVSIDLPSGTRARLASELLKRARSDAR